MAKYDIPLFGYLLGLEGGFDAGMHGLLELADLAQRWRRPPYPSLKGFQMEPSKFLCARGACFDDGRPRGTLFVDTGSGREGRNTAWPGWW